MCLQNQLVVNLGLRCPNCCSHKLYHKLSTGNVISWTRASASRRLQSQELVIPQFILKFCGVVTLPKLKERRTILACLIYVLKSERIFNL